MDILVSRLKNQDESSQKSKTASTASSNVPVLSEVIFQRCLHRVARKLVLTADLKGSNEIIQHRMSFGRLLRRSTGFSSLVMINLFQKDWLYTMMRFIRV
ncbi:hypothetical protein CUMW_088250 [Citrus unshiu]|nr:hypothetical protein CUMW_088250 [Citrus unshiu]